MHYPLLYEINTRCWLREFGDARTASVTLVDIPDSEFAEWQRLGFTHIWLMGVWASGPQAREKALSENQPASYYSEALPDWQPKDVGGSPYAIADYRVSSELGGETGLQAFRQQLHAHGLKLILDFVPNHLGLDHPWLGECPDFFVNGEPHAQGTFPQTTRAGNRWLAHGKDPNFPPWTDTAQLDYRRADTRVAMSELLQSIAERCDGVRCDMAMLLLNDVFEKTWGHFPPPDSFPASKPNPKTTRPEGEFWAEVIGTIKQKFPEFLFLAEAYWGLESRLQALGFDYVYDKELYDRLIAKDAAGVQRHLLKLPPTELAAGAHFLENHDERRVASILTLAEHRAAALVILGLPGMRLLHQGQLSGAVRRLPVQLIRRPPEPTQVEIESMYHEFLTTLPHTAVGHGDFEILKRRAAWSENPTAENFVLVQWQRQPEEFDLVTVNLAPHPSQCYAPLTISDLAQHSWIVKNLLGAEQHLHKGADLEKKGLFLDLPAHGAQLLHFKPADSGEAQT